MATIMSHSDLMQKAFKHLCESIEDTNKPLSELLEETALRYNLGPKDAQFLDKMFQDHCKTEE